MDEIYDDASTSPEENLSHVGRRRLLKALGAAGGAMATGAFIPARWVTPVVEVGYLPAHAQISGQVNLSSPARTLVQPLQVCTSNGNTGNLYQMSFNYDSLFGDVQPGSVVTQSYVFANGASGSFEKTLTAGDISGDGFQGTISYTFCSAFGPPENDSVTTSVTLRTPQGRVSTVVSVTMGRPPGSLDQHEGGGSSESL